MFLKLSGQIEGQLRDAYDKKFRAGLLNQTSLASKLNVNRSAIHHRLSGRTNMTIETIADMIWGLGNDFELKIFDPTESTVNYRSPVDIDRPAPIPPKKVEQPSAEPDPMMTKFLEDIVSKRDAAPTPV
jgi:hypothetical protein